MQQWSIQWELTRPASSYIITGSHLPVLKEKYNSSTIDTTVPLPFDVRPAPADPTPCESPLERYLDAKAKYAGTLESTDGYMAEAAQQYIDDAYAELCSAHAALPDDEKKQRRLPPKKIVHCYESSALQRGLEFEELAQQRGFDWEEVVRRYGFEVREIPQPDGSIRITRLIDLPDELD